MFYIYVDFESPRRRISISRLDLNRPRDSTAEDCNRTTQDRRTPFKFLAIAVSPSIAETLPQRQLQLYYNLEMSTTTTTTIAVLARIAIVASPEEQDASVKVLACSSAHFALGPSRRLFVFVGSRWRSVGCCERGSIHQSSTIRRCDQPDQTSVGLESAIKPCDSPKTSLGSLLSDILGRLVRFQELRMGPTHRK